MFSRARRRGRCVTSLESARPAPPPAMRRTQPRTPERPRGGGGRGAAQGTHPCGPATWVSGSHRKSGLGGPQYFKIRSQQVKHEASYVKVKMVRKSSVPRQISFFLPNNSPERNGSLETLRSSSYNIQKKILKIKNNEQNIMNK